MAAFSPSVGVTFAAALGLNIFTNFSTAYETPTTVELSNTPTGEGGFNQDLGPQDLRSFEVGARGLIEPARVRYEVAVYVSNVDNALDKLREGRAEYKEQERGTQAGDYVVVSFTGTSDGKPLTDFSPTARGMTKQENFPLHVHADDHDHFIPGFTKQLIGAKPGEERTVKVTIPDEFPSQPKLQGLNVIYEVKVMQVKEKVLPELTDEFAKSWEAESVEKLREGVRDDLKSNQEGEAMRVVRAQVHEELMKKVSFDVPEPVQQNELRVVVESMVRTRRAGGASEEDIENQS